MLLRLYQTAAAIVDNELADEVGWALYARCDAIVSVTNRYEKNFVILAVDVIFPFPMHGLNVNVVLLLREKNFEDHIKINNAMDLMLCRSLCVFQPNFRVLKHLERKQATKKAGQKPIITVGKAATLTIEYSDKMTGSKDNKEYGPLMLLKIAGQSRRQFYGIWMPELITTRKSVAIVITMAKGALDVSVEYGQALSDGRYDGYCDDCDCVYYVECYRYHKKEKRNKNF